tara:strand:- start:161 stop:403 length:243 start_codon:yes stop_codon:yes gene_type:complete
MTLEQLKAFLSKAKDDTVLQEKLKAADSPEVVVALAKEHGHDFSVDKLSRLSEEELENMTGGDYCLLSNLNLSNICYVGK